MKYKCKICGYVHEGEMSENYICPLCGVGKSLFDLIQEEKETISEDRKVKICLNNKAVHRIDEKCINCGICKKTCESREGFIMDEKGELCVNCGQCIITCPTNALVPKSSIKDLYKAINENKIIIGYTSPAVRVSIGEAYGEIGEFRQEKLVGMLRSIGFNYVFDTTFGADLTIMEEASELIERIKNNKNLPMITSCCPSWVKYAENHYPELLNNLSTCKSPIGMQGMVVKEYISKMTNKDENNFVTVAITPCTAKKYEIQRPEINNTDLVITVLELIDILKEKNINYDEILESNYDDFLPQGSSSGIIFGNTGGVMTASLRTAYYMLTKNNLEKDLEFMDIDSNIKEATIEINGLNLNVAIINEMSKAKEILDEIKAGKSKYHFIEIMNCKGGCVGGGGQPKLKGDDNLLLTKRIEALKNKENDETIRFSHDNKEVQKLYDDLLEKPLSLKSKELLHTTYINRKEENKY